MRVKKNLSVEKAGRFRKVFLESGALVQIVPAGQEPPEEPAPRPVTRRASPAPASQADEGLQLAPIAPLEPSSQPEEPRIDISSLELRKDDSPIAPAQPAVQAPLPDISNLSMAPLEESPQSDPAPRVPIPDTSHLEIAPPETGSLEDCAEEKPARPIPDISNLSLEE